MAVPYFDPSLPNPSFFDIYTDGAAPPPQQPPPSRNPLNLPSGGCNFSVLSPGANGARCGCRQFWSRFAAGRAFAETLGSDNSAWCMCGHHACFHDRGADAPSPIVGPPVPGQENERPRGNREPLSPVVQDFGSYRPPGEALVPMDTMPMESILPAPPRQPEEPRSRPPDHYNLQAQSTVPDTLSWGEYIQSYSQSGNGMNGALPPIPPQCLMPASQPTSTTSSSQARYLRPFSGKGLSTLSGVGQSWLRPQPQLQDKPLDVPSQDLLATADQEDSPATMTATATNVGSPRVPSASMEPPGVFATPSRDTFRHISDTVQGHEQRLERLENVSFTAAIHDECDGKHDATDLRVTDLECRMEEMEKNINDNASIGTVRKTNGSLADDTTNSVVSESSEATARASETYEHIRSLESHMKHMRTYMPSPLAPFELEVVFLPFPLRCVWQEMNDFKAESSLAEVDHWTQMPSTNSSTPLRQQSPFCGDWSEPGLDYSWLLPKGCNPRSIIDRRLRSRGFVRTVSIRGPDARSVQAAVQAAFGTTLADMARRTTPASPRHEMTDAKISRFFGLQHPWVPLRKIHKDDRLRFLSPAEMVTPALWNASFLNSVIMRCSEPRLFITQPEAYLQDLHAYDTGWTWQKVREMSRVYPDMPPSEGVPEGDAEEEYWAWSERLDGSTSARSSQSSQQPRQPGAASPSELFFTLKSSIRSSSPRVSRANSQARGKERAQQPSRPLHLRTTSMPPVVAAPFSPAGIRRRVASSGQRQTPGPRSPFIQVRSSPAPLTAGGVDKRRRRTRSPSRPAITPRWTMSPSPVIAMFPSDDARVPGRGVTPLYYATPHSNAPLPEQRSRGFVHVPDEDDSEDDEDYEDLGSSSPTKIYEDADDDHDDDSETSIQLVSHRIIRQGNDSQPRQPEDEPWPGIEDHDRMSDGENIDPLFSPADDDATSVASSQPSEYPSTQRGWELPGTDVGVGFHIHEDVQMPDLQ